MAATVKDLEQQSSSITHIVIDPMGGVLGTFASNADASKAALKKSREVNNLGKAFRIFTYEESVISNIGDPTWAQA